MNKAGRQTYLSKYEDSLIVAPYYIEGTHGLPLESNDISYKLQCVVKTVKFKGW